MRAIEQRLAGAAFALAALAGTAAVIDVAIADHHRFDGAAEQLAGATTPRFALTGADRYTSR